MSEQIPDPQKLTSDHLPNRLRTFLGAVFTLVVCFTASSAPIPLMSVYRDTLSLSNADVANSIVAYFVGCILTLVFFARLSNYFGRKPVVMTTLLLAMAASFTFVIMDSVWAFNLGRFLQGLSCGFASSAAMSWVVDAAPLKKRWLGTAVTAAGPNVGLCLGTLLTGFCIEYNLFDPSSLFMLFMALIGAVFCLVATASETVQFGMEPLLATLIPKIAIPKRLWRLFIVASAAYIGTWGMGSFFQGFIAIISAETFGVQSTLIAALCYLILMIPNASTGLFVGRFYAVNALRFSITFFALGGTLSFIAYGMHLPALFLVAVAICGACNGGSCTSALKLLLQDTSLKERAGVISGIYLLAYVGAGIPNAVVGMMPDDTPVIAMAPGYIGWMSCAWLIIMVGLWMMQRHPNEAEKQRFER